MLLKYNDFKGFYGMVKCDGSFDFDSIQEKCIRSFVGNCLYDEIRANVINCLVNDTAPQYIKDLVDGVQYTTTGNACCSCECQCDKKLWVGLRKLVELCIKYKWLSTKDAELLKLQNKASGVITTYEKSLTCEKIDIFNELTFINNIGDCNCVSLHRFIDDNEIEDFTGKWHKQISIV